MKFLKVLGWIFIPYIVVFILWGKTGKVAKAFGVIWALFILLITIGSFIPSEPLTPEQLAKQEALNIKHEESNKKTAAIEANTKKIEADIKKLNEEAKNKNKPTMTKAEFDELKTGMTYENVSSIIGGLGETMSESGKEGGEGSDVHIVAYSYKGEGSLGANSILMFQGEKLVSKTQIGLK